MKALLFIPNKYSTVSRVSKSLEKFNVVIEKLDYRLELSNWEKSLNVQVFRLPFIYKKKWEDYFLNKINKWYIKQINQYKPDLIFIYNNEMFLPETLSFAQKKKIKVVFYLGDNPLYTHTSPYNLAVLDYADAVFVPDTFWQFQLKKMGLSNVHHLVLPLPEEDYFPVAVDTIEETIKRKYQANIFYAGMCYNDSWGYKKAKFLSHFTEFNLKIYGNKAWKKWIPFFPELKNYITYNKLFIPTSDLNKIYNLAKIIPVDGNPGIFNGVHLRAFEALSAGTLPLMEWNADIDFIFDGVDNIPAVKSYEEIIDLTRFYINNEEKRAGKVMQMKTVFKKKYTAEIVGKIILDKIN